MKGKIYKLKNSNKTMNKKVIMLIAFALLFLIPLCSAGLGSFKQNDCVEIKTILNTSAVNISSLSYPNSSIAFTNGGMTKNALTFNYTFCDTSLLGTYIYDYFDAQGNVYVNDFDITPSGSTQTTAQGIGSLIFLILVLSLTILFGYLGWRFMNTDTLWAMGVFLLTLSLLLIIYNVWLLYEFKLNYTGSSPDALIPQIIFYIFMTVLTCGLMTAAFLLITKWKVLRTKFKNAIKPEPEEKDDPI